MMKDYVTSTTTNSGINVGMSRAAKKKRNKKKEQPPPGSLPMAAIGVPSSTTVSSSSSITATSKKQIKISRDDDDDDVAEKRHGNVAVSDKQGSAASITRKRRKVKSDDNFPSTDEGVTAEVNSLQDDIDDDDDLHDDATAAAADHDEFIPMKEAATVVTNAANDELLPKDCLFLSQILLLPTTRNDHNNAKSGSNNNNELQVVFENMTIRQRAQCTLEFLLQPSGVSVSTFYKNHYEKLPLHCSSSSRSSSSSSSSRYDGLLTLNDVRTMLQNQSLYYGKDLNVTRYEKSSKDGVYRRITLDRLTKSIHTTDTNNDAYEVVQYQDVWDQYKNEGCTIRLLCPQQHNAAICALLSVLEYEFGCMVGANVYLTPPNGAQGFAPHYDDIDAYIVQLQGRKRWKVYSPIQREERLPRTSSKDYTTSDLVNIDPVLDIVLETGDMLYMPRGWIHQACTIPNDGSKPEHSLHLTISAMQQWAWADYMEILLPEALQAAINAPSTLLRDGLPPRFLDYMGAMHDNREELIPDVLKRNDDRSRSSDEDMDAATKRSLQQEFRDQAKKRIMRVVKEAMDMIDATCDQMGKRFLSDRLPPCFSASEKSHLNDSSPIQKLEPTMLCRLVRPSVARLVLEDEMAIVYHCSDNSTVYHETPISPIEFEMDDAPALEQLLTTIPPYWICISDLIHDTLDDKVSIAQALFDEGILAVRTATENE
jgi:bifunctional lysine-specific demethylase and histidyl-hydroxylase NO66